jgi:UDP-N-acetylmuramoyl-tripeptide--D-alanyl-D-alanine ligase
LRVMSQGIKELVKYGTSEGDVTGTVLQSNPFLAVRFSKGLTGTISTQLVGAYNLPNVLAAAAVGRHFGVTPERVKTAMEGYIPSNSRSQLVRKGTNEIILDAYNANPSSMKLAIENFARLAGPNKVLVLGAMAELGEQSLEEHRAIVKVVDQYSWKAVALVGGDFQKITHSYHGFDFAAEAGAWLQNQNISHAQLLVKGSRSTGMEKVLEYLS